MSKTNHTISEIASNTESQQEFRQSVPVFKVKQDTTELDEIIDSLSNTNEVDITKYIGRENIDALIKENMKKLKESKTKPENTKHVSGKTITKADVVGGARVARKQEDSSTLKELKHEAAVEGIDVKELSNKVKEVIEKLESDAKELEKSIDFTIKPPTEEEIKNGREFLFKSEIDPCFVTSQGIDTSKYISHVTTFDKYSTKTQPKENMLDDAAKQLVYISRLSKYLSTTLLQECTLQLKFNNIDMNICNHFREVNTIPTYKAVYQILKESFKKLIIASLSSVELAFRSQNCWINDDFKKLIIKDVVMLQSLPTKLAKSWEIFVTELCKTNDANIYNDISKLDYVLHIEEDFIIEEILARSIKCMTPCFIYNYYQTAKSIYLMCGLLNEWFDKVKKDSETDCQRYYQELVNISKVCLYVYENTRLNENSTARSLPFSQTPMSEDLQMYYLNHTIIGPQYYILKNIEKVIISLV